MVLSVPVVVSEHDPQPFGPLDCGEWFGLCQACAWQGPARPSAEQAERDCELHAQDTGSTLPLVEANGQVSL